MNQKNQQKNRGKNRDSQTLYHPDFHNPDQEKYAFHRLPKFLFTQERFAGLSCEGKMLFALILDRLSLSKKNGWVDEFGRIYVYFTHESACQALGKSKSTLGRLFAQLEQELGLIQRQKQGLGCPDKIFVCSMKEFAYASQGRKEEKNPDLSAPDQSNPPLQKSVSDNSSPVTETALEFSPADHSKTEPNKTEESKTLPPSEGGGEIQPENTQTKPITQQTPPPSTEEDRKEREREIRNAVLQDLCVCDQPEEKSLEQMFYQYAGDQEKISVLLHFLCYSPKDLAEKEEYSSENLYSKVKNLYKEALCQMLSTKENQQIKGQIVTYAKVIARLLPEIRLDMYDNPKITQIMDCSIGDFIHSNQKTEIKYPLAYMKSCIWSSLQEGSVKSELSFQHHVENMG